MKEKYAVVVFTKSYFYLQFLLLNSYIDLPLSQKIHAFLVGSF